MTRKDILNFISEGVSVDEIIDSKLNVIGSETKGNNDVVTNQSTSNSFVDATGQQVGKNRYVGVYLEEANSQLQGKDYVLPDEVLAFIKTKTEGEGGDRCKGLIQNPKMSYEQMKRFKHDIENSYEGDWGKVLEWINHSLTTDRDSLAKGKKITHDTGMENRYQDEHEKDAIHAPKIDKHTLFENTNYGVYKKKHLRDILNEKLTQLTTLRGEINEIKKILKTK